MTQFTLKLIALLSMLLDHTAKVVLRTGMLSPWIGIENEMLVRNIMVIAGRMAFPIFAWFAAEGCRKTHSMGKYVLRLLVFAVLSEAPFQLCFYGAYQNGIQLGCHNVMFTLLLAVGAVFLSTWLETHHVPKSLASLLPSCAATALGWILHTDYNAWGVALVLGLYYMPEQKGKLIFLAAWCTAFQLIWHGWNGGGFNWLSSAGSIQILYWLGTMFSVLLLMAYNGERGIRSKWLFYGFYPAHLLLLFLIALAC